jgi:hypothetical protein
MPGYHSFAVLGATGGDSPVSVATGFHITKALIKNGAQVKALVREGTGIASASLHLKLDIGSQTKPSATELKGLGVELVIVNYSDPKTLESAFRGVDAVVSALGGPGLALQIPAIEAAGHAGVKLFVLSCALRSSVCAVDLCAASTAIPAKWRLSTGPTCSTKKRRWRKFNSWACLILASGTLSSPRLHLSSTAPRRTASRL